MTSVLQGLRSRGLIVQEIGVGTGFAGATAVQENIVTGTFAATESADTASAIGTVYWKAVLAATDTTDTASATGTVYWKAVLASTEASDTASATGKVYWKVVLSATEASDTASATGKVYWKVVLASTEASDIVSVTSKVYWKAVLAATDITDTASATSRVYWKVVLAATDAPDVFAGTGSVSWPNSLDIAARLYAQETAGVTVGVGSVSLGIRLAVTEAPDIVHFTIINKVSGSLATTEAADTPSFIGFTALSTQRSQEFFVSGFPPIYISQSRKIGAQYQGDLYFNENFGFTGKLAAIEAPDVVRISGLIGTTVALVATEGPDVVNTTGKVSWNISLAATEGSDVVVVIGRLIFSSVTGTWHSVEEADIAGQWLYTEDDQILTDDDFIGLQADNIPGFAGKLAAGGPTSGSWHSTEATDTPAFAGAVNAPATSATWHSIEGPDVAVLTGWVTVIGTMATTDGLDIAAAVGTVGWGDRETMVFGGIEPIYLIQTRRHEEMLPGLFLSETASQSGGVSGTLTTTEASDTLLFSGKTNISANLTATEALDRAFVSGTISWRIATGSLHATENSDIIFSLGLVGPSGSLASTEISDVAQIRILTGISGTLSATEDPDRAGFIEGNPTGILTANEVADTATIFGKVISKGTLIANESSDQIIFTGYENNFARLLVVESPDIANFIADKKSVGFLDTIEDFDQSSFNASVGWRVTTGQIVANETDEDAFIMIGAVGSAGFLRAVEKPDGAHVTSKALKSLMGVGT